MNLTYILVRNFRLRNFRECQIAKTEQGKSKVEKCSHMIATCQRDRILQFIKATSGLNQPGDHQIVKVHKTPLKQTDKWVD